MKVSIFLSAALSIAFGARAERIDVYANAFREGGWKLDVQFMDVMGSPYLLAHGMGSPVPDAVATVTVPTGGKWRVWARTRKWVDGAGAFRVLADGKALAHVFGRGDPAWGWEDGGEIRGYPEGKDAYGNKFYVTSDGGVNTLMFGQRPPLVIMFK